MAPLVEFHPPTVFSFDFENYSSSVYYKSKANFDNEGYVMKQEFYSSKDGTNEAQLGKYMSTRRFCMLTCLAVPFLHFTTSRSSSSFYIFSSISFFLSISSSCL